jgi:hypothetical protein
MTQAVRKSSRDAPRHPLAPTRSTEVEGMALVALRSMTPSEMRRMVRVLETEGITGVRLAKVRLSRADARRVAEGGAASVQATLVSEERPSADETPEQALERALSDARARWGSISPNGASATRVGNCWRTGSFSRGCRACFPSLGRIPGASTASCCKAIPSWAVAAPLMR